MKSLIKGADIIEFVSETVGDDLIEVCNAKVRVIGGHLRSTKVISYSASFDNVGMLVVESPSISLCSHRFRPKERR